MFDSEPVQETQRTNVSIRVTLCADAAGSLGPRESNCRNVLCWMSPKKAHASRTMGRGRFQTISISNITLESTSRRQCRVAWGSDKHVEYLD